MTRGRRNDRVQMRLMSNVALTTGKKNHHGPLEGIGRMLTKGAQCLLLRKARMLASLQVSRTPDRMVRQTVIPATLALLRHEVLALTVVFFPGRRTLRYRVERYDSFWRKIRICCSDHEAMLLTYTAPHGQNKLLHDIEDETDKATQMQETLSHPLTALRICPTWIILSTGNCEAAKRQMVCRF
mmetsp:Transcript_11903/g.32024  ORF Transcript_11903/g.32024 Transcript_11903/m.32024 type:complete len:184 (+) Transcript_11903:675-1226(+)